jgi:hypothetical protein
MQVMRSAKGLQIDPFALRFFARPVLTLSFHRTPTALPSLISPLSSPAEQSVPTLWLSAAHLLAYHAASITTLSLICKLPCTDGY